jgi:Protein of unknown function (DUF3047)
MRYTKQPCSSKQRFLITIVAIVVVLASVGCASVPRATVTKQSQISAFSAATDIATTPQSAWQPWIISRFNQRTQYQMVDDNGKQVLRAYSDKAASGLLQEVTIDPQSAPYLRWQWKVPKLLLGADLSVRGMDDSPVRVIVSFDGDHEKLDVEDRAIGDMVKLFSGRAMPYASIMYVWDNKLAVNTMLDNAYSSRAKMIVVESGDSRAGKWLNFSRNIVNDFKRAFGELPGQIISIAVMTDSNRTETEAIAYYGDIVLGVEP